MKKLVCLILALAMMILSVSAALAENKVAEYEELLTGTWKVVWRYLPSEGMTLNKLSDPVKPVNLFVYPEPLAKAGMTVTPYLTGDETGAVYLVLTTAGSSHGIVSFDGGYVGQISFTSDHNLLLVKGLDGGAMVYVRQSGE